MKEKTINDIFNSMDESLKNRIYILIGSIVILRESIQEESISTKDVIKKLEAINKQYLNIMKDVDLEQRAFIEDIVDFANNFVDDKIFKEN